MASRDTQPLVRARSDRTRLGERLGGFIYGTIVAMAVIVAGSRAFPDSAWSIAVMVVVTAVVFWLAHVYAHGLARSVALDAHLAWSEVRAIARREAAIVEATVLPVAALLLGAVGIVSASAAAWLALASGLVVLAAQGVVFARVERLGWLGTFVVVLANVALGAVLVVCKLIVGH
jgi:hypothetical protein